MKKVNHTHLTPHDDEDEIDIKEIFSTILRYKKSILLIVMTTTVYALFYAYFTPSIYQAESMIKINPHDYYGNRDDFMSVAMGKESSNILDELVIFKTRHIAQKALKNLNLGTQYFVTKHFKTQELYKDSPFIVTSESIDPKMEGTLFQLIPIDEKKFQLLLEPSLKTKISNLLYPSIPEDEKPILYNKIHQYGEKITTPWFTFTIQKLYELDNLAYSFSITENAHMAGLIQGGISASFNEQLGNIIILNFTDTVPQRAKEVLDEISRTYIQENLDIKAEGAKKKLHFIDMQIDAINKTLAGSSKKLQSYKATNVIVSLDSKAELASRKLSDLESNLYKINMQTDMMENIIQYMDTHDNIQGINIDSVLHANSSISRIILEIQNVLKQRATLSVQHTKSHPLFIQTTKQLNALKNSLRESILGSLRTLNKEKKYLHDLIEKHKIKLQGLPEQEQKLEQLTRNFSFNEKIYSFLLNKRAETAIIEASTVSSIRIIEEAIVPSAPVKPKRSLIILVGLILGLLIGIALAFLRDFLDDTIKTIEDIEKLTNIPIYGATSHLDSQKITPHFEEAMHVLWTNLEFLRKNGKSKLITFTSSVSGEGKTLTIYQLGNIIAKSNKSAIILDLDMRKSTLHEKFELQNTIGMSTLLSQGNTLEEVIQDTEHEHLKVITSGPKPPNPTALIMSNVLESIIYKLMEQYDYILIDSPPIGLVADAMKIMHMSDISLILLRANYSKKDFIKNINRLTKDGNINPGIILNDIALGKSYGYGYGYGYGYE